MEALAFIHAAIAYEDPTPAPSWRSWETLTPDLSTPLIHLVGAAAISLLLVQGEAALAQIYQVGDQGGAVEDIQQALGISADGVFGTQTEAAVRRFQSNQGLEVDGVVGPATLRALRLGYLAGDRQNTGGSSAGGGRSADRRSRDVVFEQPVAVGSRNIPSGYRGAARVATSGGVNVRRSPSVSSSIIEGLDNGDRVQLTGRQQQADGYRWAQLQRGGWVATNFLVTAGSDGGSGGQSPYVVVVPGGSQDLLRRVLRQVPGAFRDSNRLGDFIHAGSFAERSNADRLSKELRRAGLDARVAYRP